MNINELIEIHGRKGFHFFSKNSKRFFNSRIGKKVLVKDDFAYFITSEKFDFNSPRLYTARKMNLTTGEINTIGQFQEFKTHAQAVRRIHKEVSL